MAEKKKETFKFYMSEGELKKAGTSSSEVFEAFFGKNKKEGKAMMLISWLIISVALISVWEVLLRIIPEGWALVPVNIFCFLASFTIGAFGYLPAFRQWMKPLLAWFCALALWFLVFVVVRSLF